MSGYTKLFNSIVTSTIWQKDLATKVVWITLLALSDSDGGVEGSIPGLAHIAGVSIEECKRALEILEQPDEYSRTPDNEGRRIETEVGGWFILNRAKYRDKNWEEEKAERHRASNRKSYHKGRTNSDNCNPNVSESDSIVHKKEKEKEKELKPLNPSHEFNATEAARYVMDGMDLSGREMLWLATDRVQATGKDYNLTPQAAAELIVLRWGEYDTPEREFKVGKKKFLQEGMLEPEKWRKGSNAKFSVFD